MTVRFGFSLQGRGALADRDTLGALARRAEALGYDSIFVTDRLAIPAAPTSAYPYSPTGAFPLGPDEPWLEALTAVTWLATITERIAVGTSVLVVPYRNPIATAKALATADYLSGGRIILGAGVGWWPEEFAALGVPFAERVARTEEALRLITAVWTRTRVTFEGQFWHVRDAGGTRPHPVQRPHPPIWIGGHSDGALRRVVALADGWHPLGLRPPVTLHPEELGAKIRRLHQLAEEAGRDPATLTVAFKAPVTLRREPGGPRSMLAGTAPEVAEDLARYVAVGVGHFVLDFTEPTPAGMLETLERFAASVWPRFGRPAPPASHAPTTKGPKIGDK